MIAEATVVITAGVMASSLALTGFGLDSLIEFLAAGVVVWQLHGEMAGEERETRAVRLIGVTFFALAAYLAVEGIRAQVAGARPQASVPGLAITAAALVVMPELAVAKRRAGQPDPGRRLRRNGLAPPPPPPPWSASASTPPSGGGRPTPSPGSLSLVVAFKEGIEAWEDDD